MRDAKADLEGLRGVINRTIESAGKAGRDYDGQTRAAAVAVLSVRPDLSFAEALDLVVMYRSVRPQ